MGIQKIKITRLKKSEIEINTKVKIKRIKEIKNQRISVKSLQVQKTIGSGCTGIIKIPSRPVCGGMASGRGCSLDPGVCPIYKHTDLDDAGDVNEVRVFTGKEGVETFSIGRVLGLVGCGAHENSTVKRAQVAAIQGWVTSLGSFHPGNQKQIREPGGAEQTISNTAGCYRWYQRQGPNPCDQRGR
ncbi:hypothetical protein E3N88_43789 [Mikania micrantha]|uniref:Uncharacterized protein n=1 Tax=Mikania micrantha TaxID=192012 RepID=A0A5N6LDX6_9ASTR|nr:hypothetical protein E3N88_43789 [Mikania micrantha]